MASGIIVLITGSNGGIGFSTAEALLSEPLKYHVILCSRSLEKGEKALSQLLKSKPEAKATLMQLDVTEERSIKLAAAKVETAFGRLDVLVNNAGIVSKKTTLMDQFQETFNTNVFGPALVTEAFAPLLKKSHSPRVIYVSSGAGSISKKLDPSNPWAAADFRVYGSSKAAVNMLMAHDSIMLKDAGVKAFSFCPGYVISNLTGEDQREKRRSAGARTSQESALDLVKVIDGSRDLDSGKFLHRDGLYDW